MRRTLPLLALVLLVACKEKTPTQIVLSIVTDFAVPAELDSVRIKVEPQGKRSVEVTHPLDPAVAGFIKLPATLVLLPGPDRSQPVLITAAGSLGNSMVAERRAQLRFVEGRALLVRLALLRRCSGVRCTPEQSCGEQGCASIELDGAKLPDYTPEEALRGLDASSGDRSRNDGPRPDGPRPDGPSPDGPSSDGPRPDSPRPDGPAVDRPKQDQSKTVDLRKQDGIPDTLKPDVCVPSCVVVCGANNGCGGKCSSDNGLEDCNQLGDQADTYRCVLSASKYPGSQISQVCQYTSALGGWHWMTYNVNPTGCDTCCGYSKTVPPGCKAPP